MRELERLKAGFDVRAWLDDAGVAYSTSGDNVTRGWVNTVCPYCLDHANHLGVNLNSKLFHCWLCGAVGDVVQLIKDVEGVGFAAAQERLEQFQGVAVMDEGATAKSPMPRGGLLPSGTVPLDGVGGELPRAVEVYLERRRFPRSLIFEYGLMWCGPGGELPLRLVAPVWVGGRLVTWQAADVTGKAHVKYRSCSKERSLMNVKDVVYGIDDVANAPLVVVVEGITDRWRVGKGRCVALMGKRANTAQLSMLIRGVRRDAALIVMLDGDAHREGITLGEELAARRGGGSVRVVRLDGGDPAERDEAIIEGILREVMSR